MAIIEITLPAMGEGITDATITKIFKSIGDSVDEDETLIEIATDKVDTEIPSPKKGKLVKLLSNEGDVIKVGDTIAIISTDGETFENNNDYTIEKKEIQSNTIQIEEIKKEIHSSSDIQQTEAFDNSLFLSPLVRSIITKENITTSEVKMIKGTGLNGRITKNDVFRFLKNRNSFEQKNINKVQDIQKPIEKEYGDDVEILPMDRIRKLIAEHMVFSKRISPHVTSFIEVDMTNIVNWRNKIKYIYQEQYNEKLTFTPIFIEAVVNALKDYPLVNVSIDGDNIIRKKFINIGMATALPSGNLIVPVIKKACQQNLIGITKSVNDLSKRARENKLLPDEITGGTFTVTNFGTFDNIAGTPIINQPESAILGIGAIKKRPTVIETPNGDTIGIRHILILSLSYDHRIIDGALGGMFLKRIGENLENFDSNRKL